MMLKGLYWYQTYKNFSQSTNKIKCEMFIWYSVFSGPGLDINSTEERQFFSKDQSFLKLPLTAFLPCRFWSYRRGSDTFVSLLYHISSHPSSIYSQHKPSNSRGNIFNTSCVSLQDYKEVKPSPDFNVINICYKTKK